MTTALSAETQATLLLTAPLIAGRGDTSVGLLSPGEFNKLALILASEQLNLADLVNSSATVALARCQQSFEAERLAKLLGRGFLLSHAIERWEARAIWVMSRTDPTYPSRLKTRLGDHAPAVLYGCGDQAILNSGGLAVVGSRSAGPDLLQYAADVGEMVAQASRTLVSGGARGIDQAAMGGAFSAGGQVVGVLADSLERAVMAREHRDALMDGQLVFTSPYDPAVGFGVGLAMQRNKIIYALADAALVVSSDFEKGGTWTGAVEQLEKFKLVPIYVRSSGAPEKSLTALQKKGAVPWPGPLDQQFLLAALDNIAHPAEHEPKQGRLQLFS